MIQALGIVIVLMGLALGLIGKLYTDKIEEVGTLNTKYEEQRGKTKKALAQIEGLELQHDAQVEKFEVLQDWKGAEDVRYQKQIRRLQERQKTSDAAAKKYPERYGRIATFNIRRWMRDVCRSGGGSRDDCKIEVPKSRKAKSSAADKPDTEHDDGLEGRSGEAGGNP